MKSNIPQRFIIGIIVFIMFALFDLSVWSVEANAAEKTEYSVKSFTPWAENNGIADFLITFSESVIDETQVFTELPDQAIRVTPAIQGKVRWMARNQIGFFLESTLAPSVDYTFELSTTHFALTGKRTFTYSTPPFKIERAVIGFQYDQTLKQAKAVGTVTFNYPVSITGLEAFLSILSEKGAAIAYTFQPQSGVTKTVLIEIENILPLLEGRYLQVKIGKGFKCAGAEIGLEATSVAPIQLDEMRVLRVDQARFDEKDGKPVLQLSFTSPITLEMFQEQTSVKPSLQYQLVVNNSVLEIHADFKFRSDYTVSIKRGVASPDGSILRDTYVETLTVPDLYPQIGFTDDTFFLPRKGPVNLNVATTNIEQVKFGIARVYLSQLPTLIHQGELDIVSRINEEVITSLPLKDYLNDKHAGIFKVVVHADNGRSGYAEQLVVVTDLGIVAKKIDEELWVWVNSLDSLEAIPKAGVQLINYRDKEVLHTGETDAAGFVKFALASEVEKKNLQLLLTVAKGDDFSLLQLQRHPISTQGFNVGGIPYLLDGYEAFLYTERGVYRPGETVNLVGIVRGKDNEIPTSLPTRIEIIDPHYAVLREFPQKTDKDGACEIQISLPAYAPTGWYTARIWSGEKQIGASRFQVEEFMPDRMRVSIESDGDSYMLGDEVDLKIKAVNLFGTPAVGYEVNASYVFESVPYQPPEKWDIFSFSDSTRTFEAKWINLDEAVTDIDGKVTYQFTLPESLKPPSALSGYIQATVQELGGRAVSASKRISIHPYSHYVGIKRPQLGTVKRNEKVKFDYIVLDTAGNIAAGRTLQVTISALDDSPRWKRRTVSTVKQVESHTLKSAAAIADFSFTPTTYGIHRLEVEDVQSGAKVSTQFYVSEWGGVPWSMDNPDTLDMTLDKVGYRPGEKAILHIKAPFPGKLLLTIEREKVLHYRTVMLKENAATLTFPIEDIYAPNVYISAMLIRAMRSLEKGAPARAFGIVPLRLDTEPHRLKVEIDAPKQIRPNREVDIRFRIHGKRKKQPYRVSIAAVDEGILQLTRAQTPDPHTHFYQQRSLETISYEFHNAITRDDQFPIKPIESLADLMNLEIFESPKSRLRRSLSERESLIMQDQAASVMAMSASAPGIRAPYNTNKMSSRLNTDTVVRVAPVSLWSGLMTTDVNGHGSVRFKVPQFNGTLRLIAVAFSGADYGAATEKVQVRDPVVLLPTFPRFLSGGDRIRVPVSVFNGTDSNSSFTVKLEANGPVKLLAENGAIHHTAIAEGDSVEKQVEIAAGKEGHLFFNVIAHDALGVATFHLSASGNGEEIQFAPIRLPLRSAAPPVTKTGQGIVRENEPADFIFPSNLRADTSEFMVSVSPLPTVRFANGLRYLIQYPHGCLEQTTSRVFPLLYLSDLARIIEPTLAEKGKIDTYIKTGIAKLEDMLLPDHHFAYWPGRSRINNWSSVYASHFLVEARKAGYKVSEIVYNRMLEGLRHQARQGGTLNMPNEGSDRYTLTRAAYACYVLAAAGQPEKPVMHYLRNNRLDGLNDYSRFQLAGAFALSGDVKTALSILPDSINLEETGRRDTGRNFDSSIRAQAIMLDMLIEVRENHPAIPKLVESLTRAASKGQRWATTQENAFAFLALGKFLKNQPHQKFTGTITRNGAKLPNFDSTGTQYIGSDWDGAHMKLTVKGKGTGYYYWEAFGVSGDSYIEAYGHELRISRRYLTPDGSRVKNVFQQGELVLAEITVEALTSDLENVVIVDMLPAGLEIENSRLVSRERLSQLYNMPAFTPDYIDIRDDRLIFFGTFPYQRAQKFYYPLRAVTEGTFTVPPVSAEAMYDPTKSAVASSGTIQVVK